MGCDRSLLKDLGCYELFLKDLGCCGSLWIIVGRCGYCWAIGVVANCCEWFLVVVDSTVSLWVAM